jgi:2-haloacid dehalogenase
MYLEPPQVMLVAAHNGDLKAAQKCGLATAFVHRPTEHGPNQKTDLTVDGDWDVVGHSMIEVARKLGC